jgi:hypothetical protein
VAVYHICKYRLQIRCHSIKRQIPFVSTRDDRKKGALVPMVSSVTPCFSNTCGVCLDLDFIVIRSRGKRSLCPLCMTHRESLNRTAMPYWGGITAPGGAKCTVSMVALLGRQHFVARLCLIFCGRKTMRSRVKGHCTHARSTGQSSVFCRGERGKWGLSGSRTAACLERIKALF